MPILSIVSKVNLFSPPPIELSDARRRALLDAAVGVFTRFGFRKTSMEDVARAAGVSRQGLYLLFSNKEELFRRALDHSLSSQLTAAVDVLSRHGNSLEERLIDACDEWSGRFVGTLGTDAADLMCAGTSLAGDTLRHYEARFEKALADALADSPMALVCKKAGLCTAEAARTMHATARGLKHACSSRQEFRKGMTVAVRMFCAPLSQHWVEGRI
jgi:AcrR family transcriptional regulator